jgi:cbb3-type cytochrome oxidase subunit 3
MKILNDTLQSNGRWSQKRLMTFSSFFIAVIYAFVPLVKSDFEVKEFVFLGILASGGFSLYRTQKTNENNINNPDT